MTTPRGIANNNPGNIDRVPGVTWHGESADQSKDPRFIVFDAPEYGIRAIARVIHSYFQQGHDTVEKIISTWAPSNENATGAYISAVAQWMKVEPEDVLTFPDCLTTMIPAIIHQENGEQPYSDETIAEGIKLEE